jgi:protocatechuate 4,5-dioxygenase alpha chain
VIWTAVVVIAAAEFGAARDAWRKGSEQTVTVGLAMPPTDLSAPGTFLFSTREAIAGRRLNRFAASLRTAPRRAAFVAAEEQTMGDAGLDDDEIAMVLARDWSALIRAGVHVQVLTFIAAAVGQNLWDLGADQVGCTRDELIDACPRPVRGVPEGMRPS